jgi:tubulin---tyrosine ligase
VGALKVFLYSQILALFAAHPYRGLTKLDKVEEIDLAAHLTNTFLHVASQDSEPYVKLLGELVGQPVLGAPVHGSKDDQPRLFTNADVDDIVSQMKPILSEVFKAALANPVHFMVSFTTIRNMNFAYLDLSKALAECVRVIWCRLSREL